MSVLTYFKDGQTASMARRRGKTPPMSQAARRELGFLLRQLQEGNQPSLPHSRPMPSVGKACHELRVTDENKKWRLFYFIDTDAIVVLDVSEKKTQKTLLSTIELCQRRLKNYGQAKRHQKKS